MTLNQLRTFLAVAEHGSVRAAAQELVVTQAAVSASLAALQKSLGVALLAPDGRGLRLTSAGAAYAGYVRRILGLLEEAGLAAVAAADPERGELRIAAVTTAAEQVLPGLLSGFRDRHPGLGIRLEAGNRERVRALLDRHQVDLVLGGRPEPGWDVQVLAVRPHQLVVVASPALFRGDDPLPAWGDEPPEPPAIRRPGEDTPAARLRSVPARGEDPPEPPAIRRPGEDTPAARLRSPADTRTSPGNLLPWLARQAWLLREPGSGTRASTDALLTELGIAPLTLLVGSNGGIKESASVGLGVTLISRDAVAAELDAGRLSVLPVPGTPLHRDWYLVAHPGPLPPAAARLRDHVLAHGGFQPPVPAPGPDGRAVATNASVK